MISQAAEQLDCHRVERLDTIETLLNTVALALLIAEVALLQGATPRARVSINPLSVNFESEVSIEPHPAIVRGLCAASCSQNLLLKSRKRSTSLMLA